MKVRNVLLIFLSTAYIVFFTFISFLKFDSFTYTDFDLTMLTQTFHNTLHGRFFTSGYGDFVIFGGGHISFLPLLLLPLYLVFPAPYTLLFLQTLFLGAGIFVVYLIAKEITTPGIALCFAFIYAVYPALHYVNLYEVHAVAFSIPLLLLMFYFFLKRNFLLFVIFMLLSLLCREDVSLVVIGFGIYAFFYYRKKHEKGHLKWSLTPLLCGSACLAPFLLSIFIAIYLPNIANLFSSQVTGTLASRNYSSLYAWLREASPWALLGKIFSPVRIKYLYDLFAPLSFLPLLNLSGLIIIFFGMLETLFSDWPLHNTIYFHHTSIIIPFLIIAGIFGLSKITKIFQQRKTILIIIILSVSVFAVITIGPLIELSAGIPQMLKNKNSLSVKIKNFFVKQMPKNEPLITTFELSSHLTGRSLLCPFYIFTYKRLTGLIPALEERYNYALVDFNDPLTFYSFFYDYPEKLKSRCFITNQGWGVVETIDSLVFFKKGYQSNYKLIEDQEFIDVKQKNKIGLKSVISVLELKYLFGYVGNFPVIDLDCKAVKLKPVEGNYLPIITIVDKQGKAFKKPLFILFRLYSVRDWQEDRIVRIRTKLSLPEGARHDNINSISVEFIRL